MHKYCGALTMRRGTCGSQCWHVKCGKLMQKYCGGPDNGEGDLWFPVLACQMLETDAEVLWGPDNGEGGMWFRVLECYLHGE